MLDILRVFVVAICLQLQLASVNSQEFVPQVPSDCQSLGYCDIQVPGYPTEHVDKIIKEAGLDKANPGVVDVTKDNRRQDPAEVSLCASNSRTLIPQVAQDTSGKWSYVLNSQNFHQHYIVEICTNANSACSPVLHLPAVGYTASCQQRFISRVMIALDEQGNKINKSLKIPSNCDCQVRQNSS